MVLALLGCWSSVGSYSTSHDGFLEISPSLSGRGEVQQINSLMVVGWLIVWVFLVDGSVSVGLTQGCFGSLVFLGMPSHAGPSTCFLLLGLIQLVCNSLFGSYGLGLALWLRPSPYNFTSPVVISTFYVYPQSNGVIGVRIKLFDIFGTTLVCIMLLRC